MRGYEDLRVWRQSMELAENVYRITESFPKREVFGLTSQLRSAATSIPQNIAEGQGRISTGEWLQFLGHARGSLYEVQTILALAERLRYGSDEERRATLALTDQIAKNLAGLIEYVRKKTKQRKS